MNDAAAYAGKRVIVSGAASELGLAVTAALVERGAEVHTIDAAKPALTGIASFTECDLGDPQQIDAAVDKIGRYVHMLFNCAPFGDGIERLTERVAADMLEGSTIVCSGGPSAEAFVAEHAGDLAARGIALTFADAPFVGHGEE